MIMALFMGPLFFCKLVFISTMASASYSLLETSRPPLNLAMNPQGLEYILSWKPENNTGTPTYYRVTYKSRSFFKAVKECSNITRLFCNLTKELTVFNQMYFIKVEQFTENGTQMSALYFNPYEGTCLPPALFDISACPGCINVMVKLSSSLLEKYSQFKYTVKVVKQGFTETPIRNTTRKATFHTVVGGLSPNTNYCISVEVSTTFTKQCAPSALKCIVTSSEDKSGLIVFSVVGGIVIMVALVSSVLFLLKTGYVRLREKWPEVLKISPKFDNVLVQLDPKAHSIQIIQKSKRKGAEHNYEDDCESNGEDDGGYTLRRLLYKISKSCLKEDRAELLSIDSSSVASDCQLSELLDAEAESLQCHTNEEESTTDQIFCSTSEPNLTSLPEPEISGCLNINLNTVMVGTHDKKWDADATLSPYEEDAADLQELCVSDASKPKHFTERKDTQHTGVHNVSYAQQNSAGSGESESSDSETDCIGEYMRR